MIHRDNLAVKIAGRIRRELPEYTAHGGSLLSTRALAVQLGVSHQTVHRALRMLAGEKLLTGRPGACFSIRRARSRPRLACLLCTDFDDVKLGEFSDVRLQVRMLLEELQLAECDYRVFSFYDLRQANFSPRLFTGFDGVIAARSFSDIHSRQLVTGFPRPKVWLWNHEPSPDTGNQVIPDFMSGYSELFSRARRMGLRQCVLHCARPFFAQVMTEALLLNGWEKEEFRLVRFENPVSRLAAYKYGLTMEVSPHILHACAMDLLACGIVEALQDRKLRCGEFHVSGTGDIEGSGFLPLGRPLLTTLHTDLREMVRSAVQCLLRKIRENDLTTEIIRVKSSLVVRESALTGETLKTTHRQTTEMKKKGKTHEKRTEQVYTH